MPGFKLQKYAKTGIFITAFNSAAIRFMFSRFIRTCPEGEEWVRESGLGDLPNDTSFSLKGTCLGFHKLLNLTHCLPIKL